MVADLISGMMMEVILAADEPVLDLLHQGNDVTNLSIGLIAYR